METEVPLVRRCCFCIPLRYGLLAWGYLKLVLDVIVAAFMTVGLVFWLSKLHYTRLPYEMLLFFMSILITGLVLSLLDMGFSIMFIVAGHKKSIRLLRVYYYYSIALSSTLALLVLIAIAYEARSIYEFYNFYEGKYIKSIIQSSASNIGFQLSYLILQSYIILLVKNEMQKLERTENFRFVNNSLDPECTMITKNPVDTKLEPGSPLPPEPKTLEAP